MLFVIETELWKIDTGISIVLVCKCEEIDSAPFSVIY